LLLRNGHDGLTGARPLAGGLDGGPDDRTRSGRLDWATLMKRAYALDVSSLSKVRGQDEDNCHGR
jgi:hypothetical protein